MSYIIKDIRFYYKLTDFFGVSREHRIWIERWKISKKNSENLCICKNILFSRKTYIPMPHKTFWKEPTVTTSRT